MFERRDGRAEPKELWIVAGELPAATPDAYYRRVNRALDEMGFSGEVWKICAPAYAEAGTGGRPGIDPVVYVKMLMVGFFENLPSERDIASRCADSLSLRGFPGYSLTEATPDHSSLSVIRRRLSLEQFQELHLVLLRALREHGLLKGRQLGIDSSVIEANASLRELQQRNTQQKYWDYVKDLAAQRRLPFHQITFSQPTPSATISATASPIRSGSANRLRFERAWSKSSRCC